MKLARVVGNVVSTIKHPSHSGYKLMIVEQVDEKGRPCGKQEIVMDAACSGEGDYVLLMEDGGASMMILDNKKLVVDKVIVGVLDNQFDN